MDFIEFAKWGIRVKEEPVTQDVQVENEAQESNLGENVRGWMCKFPCDDETTIPTVVPNSQANDFLEPFESKIGVEEFQLPELEESESLPANYLGEDFEYLNLEDLDVPTCSALSGNSLISESVIHPVLVHEKDDSTKNTFQHNNSHEESDIASVTSSQETLILDEVTEEEQNVEANCNVWTVPCVQSQSSASYDEWNAKEPTGRVPEETICDVYGDVAPNPKSQGEAFACPDVELPFDSTENVDTSLNIGAGDGFISCTGNCLPKEIHSFTDNLSGLDLENKTKEKNEKSPSESSFQCPDCGKILKRSYGFITHMKLHLLHLQTDSASIKCKQCNKEFQDRKTLNLHKKICKHLKERTLGSRGKQADMCAPGGSLRNDYNADIWQNTSKHSVEEWLSHNTEEVWKDTEQPREEESTLNAKSEIDFGKECVRFSDNTNAVCSIGVSAENPDPVDDDTDILESWSSEICKENQRGRGSSSGTLSLRLFRFRKPKILLKRANVADNNESVLEAVSPTSEETCFSNLNKSRIHVEGRNVICDTDSNKVLSKLLIQTPIISKSNDCSVASNVTNNSDMYKLHVKQKDSHEKYNSATCERSLDFDNCDLLVQMFNTENGQNIVSPSLISDTSYSLSESISELTKVSGESYADATNNLISESCKQDKGLSDLKIKIKPVVVLDRLKIPEQITNKLDKFYKETTEPSELIRVTESSDESLPQNSNTNNTDQNTVVDNGTCENIPTVFIDVPNACNTHQVKDDITQKVKYCNESKMFEALKKQYCLKKCSVKLTRISIEETSRSFHIGEQICANVEREVRRCGKLKLRRTSSKIWTVTSPDSDRENLGTASDSEEYMRTSNGKRIRVSENSGQNLSFDVSTPLSRISSRKFKKYVRRCKKKFKHVTDISLPLHMSSGTRHKARAMLNTEHFKSTNFKCIWCQKIALDQEDLAKHLRTHNNEGYKCPNCAAKFHFWMEMQSHLAGCSLVSLLNCQKLCIV